MVLLGVFLDGVNVGLLRSLMITNFFFESLDGHLHFFVLGVRVSNNLVHFLSGCIPPLLVELIPVFIEGARLEPLVVRLTFGINNVDGFDSSHFFGRGDFLIQLGCQVFYPGILPVSDVVIASVR